jgi:hypothetical protein
MASFIKSRLYQTQKVALSSTNRRGNPIVTKLDVFLLGITAGGGTTSNIKSL